MEIERYEDTDIMIRAVIHNDTIYLSGQACGGKKNLVPALVVLTKFEGLLKKYGSDKRHIISATIYLKDMALYKQINGLWESWVLDGYGPACACVEAKLAKPYALVEFSIIAAVK